MKYFFLKIIIKTSLTSSIITFVLVTILQMINSEKHMRNCYMPWFSEILSSITVLLFSLSLVTIFLNLYKNIRNNFFLSFLSFYFFSIIVNLYIYSFLEGELLYILALFMPYYIILSYYFFKLRKTISE